MENINWFGNAGFSFIDTNGNKIYFIDPFQLSGRASQKADIIFITHAHHDHFSPVDIAQIAHDTTTFVAPPDILNKIDVLEGNKISVFPNSKYEVKGFSFQTIPAYNNEPERLQFHPKENNWVGYIFNLNGQKIYHAGDTDFIEEMKQLKDLNLDIAMLPIGGHYTMGPKEAAQAANSIAAKTTIPMHFKMQAADKTEEFLNTFKDLVENSNVVVLEEVS